LSKITAECQKKIDWLNDTIAKQNEMPKHAIPLITADMILKEKNALNYFVTPILYKPKPAPKVEEKKEETPKEPKKEAAKDEPVEPAAPMDVD
jgi:heat shock 70kDa protein 4